MKSPFLLVRVALFVAAVGLTGTAWAEPGGGNSGPNNSSCGHNGVGVPPFCTKAPEVGGKGALAALTLVAGAVAVAWGSRRRPAA